MADIIQDGTGDGRVGRTARVGVQGWGGIRSAANGTTVNDTATTMQLLNARTPGFKGKPDIRWLYRLFMPFNTGAIVPLAAIITACTLSMYQSASNNSGTQTRAVITQSAVADETNLLLADYNNYDALDSPDEGGPRINTNSTGWKTSVFTATGLAWIKKTGEASHGGGSAGWTKILVRGQLDINGTPPVYTSKIINAWFHTSESANPPILTITWSVPAVTNLINIKGKTINMKNSVMNLGA